MPECVSIERKRTLEAFGATIVLTPSKEGVDGSIRMAHERLDEDPRRYFMPNQFDNEANLRSHYETTGPEVFAQTNGEVDVFVAGLGTTGTIMGAGRYLKEKKPSIRLVAVEPVPGHTIQGLKNMSTSIVPGIYNKELINEKVMVNDAEAFDAARALALKEGLFVGMSSGAAVVGALKVASKMRSGTVVTILPDRGDRYLSTTLFRSICSKCPP